MRLAIIGTGRVGLVTGASLVSIGHHVTLVDIDAERVRAITQGRAPFFEDGLQDLLTRTRSQGRLAATLDLPQAVAGADLTMIAVGTPLREGSIDLSDLSKASEQVGRALRTADGYHVIAVKSTVVPGTTDTLVRGVVERSSGKPAGTFGFCMNPEFLREGSAVRDALEPDRIIIGQQDARAGRALLELYEPYDCPKLVTSLRNAELIKYTSNALLATLVSFSNEIAALCEATPGTDVETVLNGVHLDRRFSVSVNGTRQAPGIVEYLRAGCGFGGSCLPKDVAALRHYAAQQRVSLRMLEAVLAVNAQRPAALVSLAEQTLGSLQGATVVVLGLAFKPGTDDLREAPSLAVIELLRRKGARVRAYDPQAREPAQAILDHQVELCRTPEEALEQADAAVLVTAWPEFRTWDWRGLAARMRRQVLIDGRGGLQAVPLPESMRYLTIGRMPGPAQGTH